MTAAAWLLFVGGAIVTLAGASGIMLRVYRRTIGRRRESLKNIAQLRADIHLSYFTNLIGEPQRRQRIGEAFFESIFTDKNFLTFRLSPIAMTEFSSTR